MASSAKTWKKGRGKLGFFNPLIGTWKVETDSPQGKVTCTRTFARILGDAYVQLTAEWKFERGEYNELALYGVDEDGQVKFWSFTSDKKHSEGHLVDASEIHPQAIGFEAQMPAGLARMAYWPDETEGFHWVVEAKTKKGWNRFMHHHYAAVGAGPEAGQARDRGD